MAEAVSDAANGLRIVREKAVEEHSTISADPEVVVKGQGGICGPDRDRSEDEADPLSFAGGTIQGSVGSGTGAASSTEEGVKLVCRKGEGRGKVKKDANRGQNGVHLCQEAEPLSALTNVEHHE